MGYMERYNNTPVRRAERQLRQTLALFPDRETYEQWLTARAIADEHRAHMEQFLPAHLKAQGSV